MAIALQLPRRFRLPKAGNHADEYEDASKVRHPQRIGASGYGVARVAVSDGASESAFAREWANILIDVFVARPPNLCGLTEDSVNSWLEPAQERWRDDVPWDRIPWHGEAKARAGAFATLLGLTVGTAPGGSQRLSWRWTRRGGRPVGRGAAAKWVDAERRYHAGHHQGLLGR